MAEVSKVSKGEGRKLPKPNNIITIPTSLDTDFFKKWCTILQPFVKLTKKETEVVACLLKHRWELSKHITDPVLLDAMVMNEETRRKVVEECNITLSYFYVMTSTFRKHKILIGDALNPRLIPNIRKDDNGTFQLLILFKNKN